MDRFFLFQIVSNLGRRVRGAYALFGLIDLIPIAQYYPKHIIGLDGIGIKCSDKSVNTRLLAA